EIWDDFRQERQDLFTVLDELSPFKPPTSYRPRNAPRRALEHGPLLTALEQELRRRLPRLNFPSPPASLETTFRTVFTMLPSAEELAKGRVYAEAALPLPERVR